MCSRLAVDRFGRVVVIVTDDSIACPVGTRFVLVGNTFPAGAEVGIGWLGRDRGRPPTPAEQKGCRAPYNAPSYGPTLEPDDDLDPAIAIDAAYAEQRSAPADLVNVNVPASSLAQ